jgi:hypothetical protein
MEPDEMDQPAAVDSKRVFMSLVRMAAKPHAADGWQIGASGLRRRADTGHWAHFWFSTRSVPQDAIVPATDRWHRQPISVARVQSTAD